MRILKLVIILVLITISKLSSQYKTALGVKANKSLAIHNDGVGLTNAIYGIGGDFLTRINDRVYLNIGLVYSSYTTKNCIRFEDNEQLEASSFDLNINGIFYFSEPKQISPYIGAGGGLIFGISNKEELIVNIRDEEFPEYHTDFFSDYSTFLNIKAGINFPLYPTLFAYIDLDVFMINTGNNSIVPKLNLGISYWLKWLIQYHSKLS